MNTIEIDPSILSRPSKSFHLKHISHSLKNMKKEFYKSLKIKKKRCKNVKINNNKINKKIKKLKNDMLKMKIK